MVNPWTLTYPGVEYTFGPRSSGVMCERAPEVGSVDLILDDTQRPRGDGRAFGSDYRGGQTITFELLVLGADETQTRDRLDELETVWRADPVRSTPGAVAELLSTTAGRRRVAYGRPRRFAPADTHTRRGVGRVVCDFAGVDDCWYDPVEQVEWVPLVPPPSGGLVAPLVTPLTTVPAVRVPGGITVGGRLPAWPVVTIVGPITNPVVQVTGLWSMALAINIPAGQQLTADTRPWRRTVLRDSDGASFAGALTRQSVRLADAALPPGRYEIALRGVDVSGTARMRFGWQSRYATV